MKLCGRIAISSQKKPDAEIRRRMWLAAQFFDAKDQGDKGEMYGKDGEVIEAADATVPAPRAGPKPRMLDASGGVFCSRFVAQLLTFSKRRPSADIAAFLLSQKPDAKVPSCEGFLQRCRGRVPTVR